MTSLMSSDDHQPEGPSRSHRARACARTVVDRALAFLLAATRGGGRGLCLLLLPPLALLVVHLSSDIHERGVRAQRRRQESVSGERGDGRVSGRVIWANQPAARLRTGRPAASAGRPRRARRSQVAPPHPPPPPGRRAAVVPHSARLTAAPNLAAHLIDELVGVNQAHTELAYGRVGVLALGPRRKTNVRHRRVGRCPRLRARGARLRAGGGLLG